jgi:hypothetical protein
MSKLNNEGLIITLLVILTVVAYFYFFYPKNTDDNEPPSGDTPSGLLKAISNTDICSNFKIQDYIKSGKEWQLLIVDNFNKGLSTVIGCKVKEQNSKFTLQNCITKCVVTGQCTPADNVDDTFTFSILNDNVIIADKIFTVTQLNGGLPLQLVTNDPVATVAFKAQLPQTYGWSVYFIPTECVKL